MNVLAPGILRRNSPNQLSKTTRAASALSLSHCSPPPGGAQLRRVADAQHPPGAGPGCPALEGAVLLQLAGEVDDAAEGHARGRRGLVVGGQPAPSPRCHVLAGKMMNGWCAGQQDAGEPQRLDHVLEIAAPRSRAGPHTLVVSERRAGRIHEAEVAGRRLGHAVGERVDAPGLPPVAHRVQLADLSERGAVVARLDLETVRDAVRVGGGCPAGSENARECHTGIHCHRAERERPVERELNPPGLVRGDDTLGVVGIGSLGDVRDRETGCDLGVARDAGLTPPVRDGEGEHREVAIVAAPRGRERRAAPAATSRGRGTFRLEEASRERLSALDVLLAPDELLLREFRRDRGGPRRSPARTDVRRDLEIQAPGLAHEVFDEAPPLRREAGGRRDAFRVRRACPVEVEPVDDRDAARRDAFHVGGDAFPGHRAAGPVVDDRQAGLVRRVPERLFQRARGALPRGWDVGERQDAGCRTRRLDERPSVHVRSPRGSGVRETGGPAAWPAPVSPAYGETVRTTAGSRAGCCAGRWPASVSRHRNSWR